ncbi:class I SAM-dependent methyltransferase [Limosilactobacillus reuteri]|uniref:class I SAM-dependent methyltransferase n=1 Tax=Limosilactobacillus reuteri TaxID=1598 RepID=UPI001E49D23B|nr:class I SAM-dependent methyltransferase [Limosilactobacillus reuteri]MCC4371899.1 class I SAM-dependent methyltransferase [Limosilactobacillus reuteri]MCC4509634.1 class I SAM-dependent methyltransferase [Limosilactobacillus reuteri]
MKILDVCCGAKMFWYDKQEEHTTYMDIRKAVYTTMDRGHERRIEVNPDIQTDWKHIPFYDGTFDLVIFDPPHLIHAGKTSWLAKKYGVLNPKTWKVDLHEAFHEIMRVLKPTGTMIFKWNEDQIPVKEVFETFGQQPILGDMRSKTKWSVFIKSGN